MLASSNPGVGRPTDPSNQQAILQFLNKVIDWYQQQSATGPAQAGAADVAFAEENQPSVDQILHLSFDFARASAQSLAKGANPPSTGSGYEALKQSAAKLEASSSQTRAEVQSLRQKLNTAPKSQRRVIQSHIAKLDSESSMAQARLDTLHDILGFAAGTSSDPGGLTSHIDALERSFPARTSSRTGEAAIRVSSLDHAAEPGGIWGILRQSFRLSSDLRGISGKMRQTDDLILSVKQLQASFRDRLAELAQQGDHIVGQPESQDPDSVTQQKASLDALTNHFRLLAAAALPLSKGAIVLDVYKKNLINWYGVTKSQYSASIKSLLIRLLGLSVLIGVVLGLFELWRRAIFRYITDYRRRYQFLLLRRIVLWLVIALVITLGLVSQLGSLATFAGLLTAGVAVALQNVILAVVGYFLLIGKFGVGVGDRVQVSDVTGEVVEIGLIRLHLMELTGTGADAQPTGRIVAFSNSIVFQTAAGLFRQVPGTSFVWRETSFTLAADSDYRAVEERLLAAVDAAFQDFKADFEQLGRQMEKSLTSVAVGPLAPRLRFKLTPAGLEVALRFPVEMRRAEEIDDRVTRELLRAIEMEPKLKIVAAEVPAIQLRSDLSRSSSPG